MTEKQKAIDALIDEFRDFLKDAIEDGHADDIEDPLKMLEMVITTFIDIKINMEES